VLFRSALVVPVAADGRWSIDLSVGRHYRLDGVACLARDASELAAELARAPHWSLLDETWTPLQARRKRASVAPVARTLERAPIARVELLK
jgi:hypothetical protein